MDGAMAWAKPCPNPMPGPSGIEIRPFFEVAPEFGDRYVPVTDHPEGWHLCSTSGHGAIRQERRST